MTGNNQTQGQNQPNRIKKNYAKNQQNQELVLWENQQDKLTRGIEALPILIRSEKERET